MVSAASQLQAMAQVKICLDAADDTGLTLTAPGLNEWGPDDDYAKDFANLPAEFAKSYLRLRLRNFLYETFCLIPNQEQSKPNEQPAAILNDRVGGGLQVELLQQFDSSNQAKGYFDSGWQVVRLISSSCLTVEKYGVTIHIDPNRHLKLADQTVEGGDRAALFPGDSVAVLLPGYRYEPGCYVAISDLGPVWTQSQQPAPEPVPEPAPEPAVEIYFAATVEALAPIMRTITAELSAMVPYTLRVPYQPEDYGYAESVALRVRRADYEKVLPVVQQMVESVGLMLCETSPVFALSLWRGVSEADVIDSEVTQWYGSSADLSRVQLVADALVQVWYEDSEPSLERLLIQNLAAMQAEFAEANVCWQEPFRQTHITAESTSQLTTQKMNNIAGKPACCEGQV